MKFTIKNKKRPFYGLFVLMVCVSILNGDFFSVYNLGYQEKISGTSIEPTFSNEKYLNLPKASSININLSPINGHNPVAYIPITIINDQDSETPINFTQKVAINPSENASFFAANMSNINWQNASGHIFNSWLESGASNLSIHTVYWISLDYNTIAAFENMTIYAVIYPTNANVMNKTNTGAYPLYSSTYAEYDNGEELFPSYYNFLGSFPENESLPNGLTALNINGSYSYTVNNGLTLLGFNGTYHIYTENPGNYEIAEIYLEDGQTLPGDGIRPSIGLAIYTSIPIIEGKSDQGFVNAYRYDYYNESDTKMFYRLGGNSNGYAILPFNNTKNNTLPAPIEPLQKSSVMSLVWDKNLNNQGAEINYSKIITWSKTNLTSSPTYIGITLVRNASMKINWFRSRILPPYGVMPNLFIEPLVNASLHSKISNPTCSLNQGQTLLLNSNSFGISPCEYQWYAKAPDYPEYISISSATSPTYLFAPESSNSTGVWFFKLQLTDGIGRSINSTPYTIYLNYPLAVPELSITNDTINYGQSTTLSVSITTGSSPYTYQWYILLAETYVEIPNATDSSYTFNPTGTGNWHLRVKITDSSVMNASVTTDSVKIIVLDVMEEKNHPFEQWIRNYIVPIGLITTITPVVVLKQRSAKLKKTQRQEIPLKMILSHINHLPIVKIGDSPDITAEKGLLTEKTILNKKLAETQQRAEELFAEGNLIEVQKFYELTSELLFKLDRKEEAQIYKEMIIDIKNNQS
jgi:hypothetical protein